MATWPFRGQRTPNNWDQQLKEYVDETPAREGFARIIPADDVDAYVAQLEATLPPGTPYMFLVQPFDVVEGVTGP